MRPWIIGIAAALLLFIGTGGTARAQQKPKAQVPDYGGKVDEGVRLILAHDVDGAIAALQKAITIAPQKPQAHYFLGTALRDKGRLEDAVQSFETAARMAKGDANWQARGWVGAAMTLEMIATKRPTLPEGTTVTPETPRINEPALAQVRDAWNRVRQAAEAGATIVPADLVGARLKAIDALEQTEEQAVEVRKRIAERAQKNAEPPAPPARGKGPPGQ